MKDIVQDQIKSIKFSPYYKETRITKIINDSKTHMDAYFNMIKYENDLLNLEDDKINLPDYHEDFKKIYEELRNG